MSINALVDADNEEEEEGDDAAEPGAKRARLQVLDRIIGGNPKATAVCNNPQECKSRDRPCNRRCWKTL